MRRFFAVLALAAFAAACSETPTQPGEQELLRPSVSQPQFAKTGAENGAWTYRVPSGCQLWGWDGQLIDTRFYPYKGVFTPSGVFSWQCWVDEKIPNPIGRPIHFGPDNTPQSAIDVWAWAFGTVPVNGLYPSCDIDLRRYPNGYDVFPIPDAMKPNIQCTWNWRYTISASGEARFTAIFDPGHSWYPYR